jgi:hypothetical protein
MKSIPSVHDASAQSAIRVLWANPDEFEFQPNESLNPISSTQAPWSGRCNKMWSGIWKGSELSSLLLEEAGAAAWSVCIHKKSASADEAGASCGSQA